MTIAQAQSLTTLMRHLRGIHGKLEFDRFDGELFLSISSGLRYFRIYEDGKVEERTWTKYEL